MPFKPGEGGRPKGSKNKSTKLADEAFELAFQQLQEDETTSLGTWAKENKTEFYKLYARKLTTTADNTSHVVTESVSDEQARVMAEAFIESTRNRVGQGKPGCLHEGISSGLPAGEPAPQDSGSPREG